MARLAFFIVFLFTWSVWANHPYEMMFTRGDVNNDRKVDISDALAILDTLFTGGTKLMCEDASDANDDGMLDITDAVSVLNFLFVNGKYLPYPGHRGLDRDPTKDTLGCECYVCIHEQAYLIFNTIGGNVTTGSERMLAYLWFESAAESISASSIKIYGGIKTKTPRKLPPYVLSNFTLSVGTGFQKIISGPKDFSWLKLEDDVTWYGVIEFSDPWVANTNDGIMLSANVLNVLEEGDFIYFTVDNPLEDIKTKTLVGPQIGVTTNPIWVKSPRLKVSLDTSPPSQGVVIGTQDFEFARLILDASQSSQDIRIIKTRVVIRDRDAFPDIVKNIELFEGNKKIPLDSSEKRCTGATCSTVNSEAATTFAIKPGNLTVPKGHIRVLRIIGDVGTAVWGGNFGSFAMYLGDGDIVAIDENAQSVNVEHIIGKSGNMSLQHTTNHN